MAVAIASLVAAWAPARAHLEVGEKSLIAQVAGAALIVHARIEEAGVRFQTDGTNGSEARDGGAISRPVVRLRVLETLKGRASSDRILMAQHGHGVAEYRSGEEALLFLDPIAEDAELSALVGLEGAPTHVSRQEHDDAHRLEPRTRGVLLAAVRDLVRAQALPDPAAGEAGPETGVLAEERRDLLHRATLSLLTRGDDRLAAGLLATLGSGPGDALLRREDVPLLLAVVRDASRAVGYRGALLATLESLGWVDGAREWPAFLRSAPPHARGAALRAAGGSRTPAVTALLVSHLADEDASVAADAAIALGRPGRTSTVPSLVASLDSERERVRFAAIRALTSIGGRAAADALERTATSHADESTRRRARAALRRVGGAGSR